MKCTRISLDCDVEQYKVNSSMEDGFELFSDVIIHGWINPAGLIRIERDDGTIVCPYISHRRGKTFLKNGDYIITDSDGTKHVCGEDKIWNRYKKN